MQTIFDIARIRAGQNNTTVEVELYKLSKRGHQIKKARKARKSQPKSRFDTPWARGESAPVRMPYSD